MHSGPMGWKNIIYLLVVVESSPHIVILAFLYANVVQKSTEFIILKVGFCKVWPGNFGFDFSQPNL